MASSSSSNVAMVLGSKGKKTVVVLMLAWILVMASVSNARLMNMKMKMQKEIGDEQEEVGCMSCPYLVVLGASMVDVGENAIAMPSRSNSEFLPYGIDYFGKPAARYSNGRLFVDFLSQELGYGLLHPYLKSVGVDFSHGVSFGSSGSTIQNRTLTGTGSNSGGLFSFLVQVDQLRQFKEEVLTILQHALPPLPEKNVALNLPSLETLEEAVVLIEMGLNDYTFFDYDVDDHEYELVAKAFIDPIMATLELGIRSVLELGMKKFVVMNLYPMGCMPVMKSIPALVEAERDSDGCIIKANLLSDLHNERLLKMLHEKLALEYPSATFVTFDANSLIDDAIHNPSIYGVKYPLEPCCGYFNDGELVMCGESGYIKEEKTYYVSKRCEDPSLYLSWDGIHPTETFACHTAHGILSGSFLFPPPFKIQNTCTTTSSG